MAAPRSGARQLVLPALALLVLASGCAPAYRHPSWAIYPLQRREPHDGVAVVSQPDGYGLHIWIDSDSRATGVCRPRWLVDAARLFNGNGSAPFSSGLAPRSEFFAAVARRDVRRVLKREAEALCRSRHPRRRWQWQEPPRRLDQVQQETFPLLEEPDLLSNPAEVRQQEEQLQGR